MITIGYDPVMGFVFTEFHFIEPQRGCGDADIWEVKEQGGGTDVLMVGTLAECLKSVAEVELGY